MKLLKYLDFILEARGDVKCPSVISESFIKRCKKIDSPISQAIIDMDRKPSSYTFIDGCFLFNFEEIRQIYRN